MQDLYTRYNQAKKGWWHEGGFSQTEFATLMVAYEYQPFLDPKVKSSPGYQAHEQDIIHGATHSFYANCYANAKNAGGTCSGPTPQALLNWVGNMQSARGRYADIRWGGETVAENTLRSGANLELANKIMDSILNPTNPELVAAQPPGSHPFSWVNRSCVTRDPNPSEYVYSLGGGDPWYLMTASGGNTVPAAPHCGH